MTLLKSKNKKEKYSMNDIEKMGEAIKSLTDVISSKSKKINDNQEIYSKAEDNYDNEESAETRAKE